MVQNGWGMAMDGEEKAGLWRSPWGASGRGGRQDTRRGHRDLCGLRPLLGARQLDSLDRLGTHGGRAQGPDGSRAGRVSGRKEDRFPPTSRRRDLGSGPWEGQGKPGACSQLWRGGCLTRLTMDSTRLGEWAQIPFVLQLPRQNEALQVRKAGDRALVKDTLSRMALGPGGRAGRGLGQGAACHLRRQEGGRRK